MANLNPLDTIDLPAKFAWERPERKDQAGSLIIFGGVSLKLKEVDTIFKSARAYGIGSVYALVPESLAKVFKREDPYLVPVNFDGYYGLTDSGQKTFQEEFALSDSLVLADIGKSSSTEHKLALQLAKTFKPVIITDSATNLILNYHSELLSNPRITLLLNIQNLQRVIKASGVSLSSPLLSTSSFKQKIELLHELQIKIDARVVLLDENRIISIDGDLFLNLELKLNPASSLELASKLIAWQIWSPKSTPLEQLFAATL